MEINTLIKLIEKEFPLDTALDGDRVGLQIRAEFSDISNILCAYELTSEVIDEAILNKSEMIIVFHPLIYLPLKNVNLDDRVSSLVHRLIKNDISLYVIHTNFDTHPKGTNSIIADKLNLKNRRFLRSISENYPDRGMGIFGSLDSELNPYKFMELLNSIFSSPVKFCIGAKNTIKNCAFVGGSGFSFINDAIKLGADCYITADLSYHNFHQYKNYIWLIDIGHYEMEQFNHFVIADIIKELTNEYDISIVKSKVVTNPVDYFPNFDYTEKQKKIF